VLAGVLVCGCATVSPDHASTVKAPAARAEPATDAATVTATAATVSTAATASTTTSAAAGSKVSNADSKVTCDTEVPTGSRVGVRVCATTAQRAAREAAVRAAKDQLSRPAPGCARIGPGGCSGGN